MADHTKALKVRSCSAQTTGLRVSRRMKPSLEEAKQFIIGTSGAANEIRLRLSLRRSFYVCND